MIKTPEHVAEIVRIREVAKNFIALIDIKQSEYDELGVQYDHIDLVVGSGYEDQVAFQGTLVEVASEYGVYQWVFTPRVGGKSATLTESFGFN